MQVKENVEVSWSHRLDAKQTNCLLKVNGTEFQSTSKCVHGDQFSYAVGRKMSLKNVFKHTSLAKSERTEIWKTIMSRGVKLYTPKKK